MYITNLNFKS